MQQDEQVARLPLFAISFQFARQTGWQPEVMGLISWMKNREGASDQDTLHSYLKILILTSRKSSAAQPKRTPEVISACTHEVSPESILALAAATSRRARERGDAAVSLLA